MDPNRGHSADVRDKSVAVTVIIPCRNAALHVSGLLQSLTQQTFQKSWEVIMVDNGSTDRCSSIAEKFLDQLNLKIVSASASINASYARNVGVGAASGQKLLFVDADDELGPGYVAAMAAALDSNEFITSRVDSISLNRRSVCDAQSLAWQENEVEIAFDFLPATGINIGIRRSLFESIGGFPEEYSGSQDIAFSWRAQLRTGIRIHFVPEAVYRYRHRDTIRGLYRQSCNWGCSNVLLYREFREHGMPGKSLKAALWDWKDAAVHLLRAHSKNDVALQMVRLGYCVGRLKGSMRYRVVYL
jgi:glycosyltransferase involved in cell wall biosynthesis